MQIQDRLQPSTEQSPGPPPPKGEVQTVLHLYPRLETGSRQEIDGRYNFRSGLPFLVGELCGGRRCNEIRQSGQHEHDDLWPHNSAPAFQSTSVTIPVVTS